MLEKFEQCECVDAGRVRDMFMSPVSVVFLACVAYCLFLIYVHGAALYTFATEKGVIGSHAAKRPALGTVLPHLRAVLSAASLPVAPASPPAFALGCVQNICAHDVSVRHGVGCVLRSSRTPFDSFDSESESKVDSIRLELAGAVERRFDSNELL